MELKLFPHHTGVWEGTYKRLAANGSVMFEHSSRLTLRLDGNKWYQTNYYTFENGREEFHNFGEAIFNEKGIMVFDNPRIYGEAWEGDRNIMLNWTYKDQPGSQLYEMITSLGDGHRMRVWQFSQNGVFQGLMMIEERKVADQDTISMSHYEQKSYVKAA
ncbi:MAG: DUF3598 family protein [Bacteroidota bacterium]